MPPNQASKKEIICRVGKMGRRTVPYLAPSIIVFILLFAPFFCDAQAEADTDFATFFEDYNTDTGNFSSYDAGDTVMIRDEIAHLRYLADEDVTEIWLESVGAGIDHERLTFLGDLRDRYEVGEKIEISLHIIEDGVGESYSYSLKDINKIDDGIDKVEKKDEKGLNVFGYHVSLPEKLDTNIGHFLLLSLIWLAIAIAVYFIINPVIRTLTKKTETKIDDMIVDIVRVPILILIFLYGMVDSLHALGVSGELQNFISLAYNMGIILVIIWLVYRIFNDVLIYLGHKAAKRHKPEFSHTLLPVIRKLGVIIIFLASLMYVFGIFGLEITGFLAGAGVIGLVIAFAAQETLGNFFAGMFLIMDPRFKVGDLVTMDNHLYRVSHIGIRSTELYNVEDNTTAIIPNSLLANQKIYILTAPDRLARVKIDFGVAYGSDVAKVEKVVMSVINKHPEVIQKDEDHGPLFRFTSMGDSALIMFVKVWVKEVQEMWRIKHELTTQIYNALNEAGIEIPFPQMDVWMKKDAK